jgi:DNA-binding LytR/AlgR family response regulator
MIRIAIVEDEQSHSALLESHIKRYAQEHEIAVSTTVFQNVVTFLEKYAGDFDIVFMDIMMPMMNGMDASRMLREKDGSVVLVFVTSMRQYAIQGYEVSATDFIVKPVAYSEFNLKFTRILSRLPQKQTQDVLVKTDVGIVCLAPSQIRYIEVRGHHSVYHTKTGEYRQYRTMKSIEDALSGEGFARCNNFLLVNLAYVERIDGLTVVVSGEELQISQPRKKPFTDAFIAYTENKRHG